MDCVFTCYFASEISARAVCCHKGHSPKVYDVNIDFFHFGLPLPDLIVGASIYFPPIFKAFLLGLLIWAGVNRVLRDWMYSGEVWHPTLMNLSLFILSIFVALLLLIGY